MAYVKRDKLGQSYMVVGARPNRSGFPTAYVKLGGKTYKIEPSASNTGGVEVWLKITAVNNRKTSI